MPTAWIYQLSKQDLIATLEDKEITTEGRTVDELRKILANLIKEQDRKEEREKQKQEEIKKTMSEDEQMFKNFDRTVISWNIYFDTNNNSVEFLERLDELIATLGIDKQKVIQLIPRCLRGKALLWHRNNSKNWKTWEDFTKDFKLFYFPRNYDSNLLETIVSRKQSYRETFVDYLTDMQTLIRRYGKMSNDEELERIYNNMAPSYRYYVKRQDFETLHELIEQAGDYEKINTERYRNNINGSISMRQLNQEGAMYVEENRQTPTTKPRTEEVHTRRMVNPNYNSKTCCWKCGKEGHSAKDCRGKPIIFCSGCGILGRMSKNCCRTTGMTPSKIAYASVIEETKRKDNRLYIDVKLYGKTFQALVDTGSTSTCMNEKIAEFCYDKTKEITGI